MFTGLIEATGTVASAQQATPRDPCRLSLRSALPMAEVAVGDSIAVDGCCLTVVARDDEQLAFEAATETLRCTTLGRLQPGQRVNLERSLRVGDRLGGHLVAGHIDGVGTLTHRAYEDSALYLGIDAPHDVARLIAARGSITVSGVSLTVTKVQHERFFVAIIPHTSAVTTLAELQPGQQVNLEADLLARYVERLLQTASSQGPA